MTLGATPMDRFSAAQALQSKPHDCRERLRIGRDISCQMDEELTASCEVGQSTPVWLGEESQHVRVLSGMIHASPQAALYTVSRRRLELDDLHPTPGLQVVVAESHPELRCVVWKQPILDREFQLSRKSSRF